MKLNEITNSLSNMNKSSLLESIGLDDQTSADPTKANSFSQILEKSLEELNQTQVTAYEAMEDIATGKVENLQDAVRKIEEAELSLKLGLEVKNKALGAYKQIMAMQI